ncbi:MAG: shikimate dehydrogenase [Eubacteriales bacterium]|nr:shikimate dehydrogenase [Eubacteriales bacterium]
MNLITGHTKLTALLGSPVSHSISPLMHNEAFRQLGLDYVYLCFEVTEDTLPEAVAGLKTCGIRGFNLTMPNKNKIVELLDELSPAAQMIGAVNTVVNENGRLIGYNTDGIGYMQAARDAGHDLTGKTITMMGAGGAATAICAQAALDGVNKIHIFARPTSRFWTRTANLVRTINSSTSCQAVLHDNGDMDALKEATAESYLLLNATSVGMAPNTDASIITDSSLFRPELVVSDVIYNPQETLLLRQAKEAGCQTFNGMYMLLYQGAEAFRLWTGTDMPIDLIKEKYFQIHP